MYQIFEIEILAPRLFLGNGFVDGLTTVTIGGVECPIESVNFCKVRCVTAPSDSGEFDLLVRSHGLNYATQTFTYSADETPMIHTITPDIGRYDFII